MLDIHYIRNHAAQLQQVADQKGINLSLADLLDLDRRRLAGMREIESKRKERNDRSQQIAVSLRADNRDAAEQMKEEVRQINAELKILEAQWSALDSEYQSLLLMVPNPVSPDTPSGLSDADNVELKRVGMPPEFDFEMKDHVLLGEKLDLFDLPRGVKVAGTRNYFLKGAGLLLHRAVQQLAIDLLMERGFTVMDVPLIVREESMRGTGFFPLGEDQTYEIALEGKWLVGTAEVPLISYYSDEIIDVAEPIRLAGVSACFRKEAGSAGRDVRGLYRVHQFAKVEQVILCRNDAELSERLLQELTKNAEDLLTLLEIPYRVVAVCIGDMSQKNYKQYDIEAWMPSRNGYGETHSSSSLLDFQARRSNIRYRDDDGQTRFCHTLNNTAVASPRILIPLLENHQRADGSVYLPPALRRYMNGLSELRPKADSADN